MALALLICGVTIAALWVWLVLRIINRKERWAKWTLAAVVGAPVLYVASFGPWCWSISQSVREGTDRASLFYRPMIWMWLNGPKPAWDAIDWYANLGSAGPIQPGEATQDGGTFPKGTTAITSFP